MNLIDSAITASRANVAGARSTQGVGKVLRSLVKIERENTEFTPANLLAGAISSSVNAG
jgi:hypothetical protein